MVQTLTRRDEIILLTKAIIIVKDWITMLRKASEARANRRLRLDTVSHAGEQIVKANRSIHAQELSVVRRANVDIVPTPARKKNNNRCVSAKRSFSRKLCLALSAKTPVSPRIR